MGRRRPGSPRGRARHRLRPDHRAPDGAARVHRRAPEQHRGKGEGISAWLNTPDGAGAHARGPAREGRPGRLLDLLLHQLPAHPPPRRGMGQDIPPRGTGGRRRPHPRVRLRARRVQHLPRRRRARRRYPIGVDNGIKTVDNEIKTWSAYHNQFWPAEYLIDAAGQLRHVHFGEGEYGLTESLIRDLLVAADSSRQLPPPTLVDDTTPTERATRVVPGLPAHAEPRPGDHRRARPAGGLSLPRGARARPPGVLGANGRSGRRRRPQVRTPACS